MEKEIISLPKTNSDIASIPEMSLVKLTEQILTDVHTDISTQKSISVPISQLAMLGAGVSSLIPSLRTVTQTTSVNLHGIYRLVNAGVGDTLKVAKNGNFWGAFKTAEGTSKFAQLQVAGPLAATNTTVLPIEPATIMMAVALFSIEQKLDSILETGKQILSFLESEKESEIEADVETLSTIISKYKFNWDNKHFVSSNHKLVLDIQRTARKNMNLYHKKVSNVLNSKYFLISQQKVNTTLNDLLKQFKYYRLSLYTFAMASLEEIMLSGNFKEENIACVMSEVENLSMAYRELYSECSLFLEKMSDSSLETNVLNSIGTASKTIGNLIGSIPVIKEGSVDELLQASSAKIKKKAVGIEQRIVESFAKINNPGTSYFIKEMEDMIQIYGHTTDICFDQNHVYLITA